MSKFDPFIEKLQLAYENDHTVKFLIKSTPLTDFFHELISERVKEIRYQRTKLFFDELNEDNADLSTSTIESEDFLYYFMQSFKYAIGSRREEKVKIFARLLKSGVEHGLSNHFDQFEEYSRNIDQLSYREIMILSEVANIESAHSPRPSHHDDYVGWLNSYQNEVLANINERFSIPKDEIPSILESISKSGFLRRCSIAPSRETASGASMRVMVIILDRGIYEPTPYFLELESLYNLT